MQTYVVDHKSLPIDLIVGAGPSNPTPGRLSFSLHERTYIGSVVAQTVAFVATVATLGLPFTNLSPIMRTMLVVEVGVQGWCLIAYTLIATAYFASFANVSASYRFSIWIPATVARVVTLNYFALLQISPGISAYCFRIDELQYVPDGTGTIRAVALILTVVFSTILWLPSLAYELRANIVARTLDRCSYSLCIPLERGGGAFITIVPYGVISGFFITLAAINRLHTYTVAMALQLIAWIGMLVISGLNRYSVINDETANAVYNVVDVLAWSVVPLLYCIDVLGQPDECPYSAWLPPVYTNQEMTA